MVFQKQVHPNSQFLSVHPVGLDPKKKYRFYGRESALDIRTFGDLINAAVPIHVKQGSLLHNVISKFVQPKGDNEDYTAYGDALMNGGIGLKPAFSSTGFDMDGSVRVMGDFEARMYFMEEV